MYDALVESLLLLGSIVLSAFYSGSEAALYSISVDRTKQLIQEGGIKGKALEFTARHAHEILTTILVGNTLVNIYAASLTTSLAQRYLGDDAMAISVGVTTMVILMFGEILPKTFARKHAEQLVGVAIRILQINYFIFYPAVMPISWFIRRAVGKSSDLRGRIVTIDDIEFMVSKAEKEKTIDSKQLDLLSSILEFPTIKVKDIMIPRSKVKYVQVGTPFSEVLQILGEDNHSRYPVCDSDLDSTIGFLHVKDLVYINLSARENFDIREHVKAPFFVYEHMKIQAVFDHMNRKKVHLALVKNENGIVVGIVTLEDIMEEIFGEILDEHDIDIEHDVSQVQYRPGEGFLVEGSISLRDLYNEFDLKIPLRDNYSTLAGFLMDRIGSTFPKKGMMIIWDQYVFKLEKVEHAEIRKVLITGIEGQNELMVKRIGHVKNEEHTLDVSVQKINEEEARNKTNSLLGKKDQNS